MLRVEVVRSGQVEAVHLAAMCAVGPDGRRLGFSGEVERPFFFRSAAKPLQATVALETGVDLVPTEIAVACASHDGHPVHLEAVRSILARAGLGEDDLRCPPSWPLAPEAVRDLAAAGHLRPRRLWHNCSGKHAAMLAASVHVGWDLTSYRAPDHPLQRRIAALVEEVSGRTGDPVGVDGCGVPVFTTTVDAMARTFARLGTDPRFRRIRGAMSAYPALVSGVGNPDAVIATWTGGYAKRGAVGCLGVGIPGVLGMAVKVWDGSDRAAGAVAAGALRLLGVVSGGARGPLGELERPPVVGGDRVVGSLEVRGGLDG